LTVVEIITKAQFLSDEEYDNAEWIKLINACLDDLTPVAKMLTTKENINLAVVDGGASLSIASDPDLARAYEIRNIFFTPVDGSTRELKRRALADNYSPGWKQTADKLLFQGLGDNSGTIRVDYYKRLTHVANINDIPELPVAYHELIVLYLCAKAQQKEEELDDKNDFYAEYLRGKQNMALERIWQMEPENREMIRNAKVISSLGGQG